MLMRRSSICCEPIITSFLVSLIVHLCSSQKQAPSFQNNCNSYGLTCIVFSSCPNAAALISSKNAIPCGFQTEQSKQNIKICCKLPNNGTSTTTSTNLSPSQVTTSTNLSPSQNTSAPVIRFKETTKPKPTSSPRNATAIALENCAKYAAFKYVRKFQSGQLPGQKGQWFNSPDCVLVATLIVGGAPAQPKEYPHMALIGYGNDSRSIEWGCGGTLISERFILSAAHCGKTSALGPPRWALLGDLTLTSRIDDARPVTYSIVRVHDHPNYKPPSYYYDISLFELNTTVKMSPYVRPACLYTSTTNLHVGNRTSITGWGRTGTIDRTSEKLLKASISIMDDNRCKTSFNGINDLRLANGYDTTSMICAGDLIDGNDTCAGDSGGPLQILVPNESCMWNIIGVTSFGPGICGNFEDPGVYTKVAFYLDWIQKIVWP